MNLHRVEHNAKRKKRQLGQAEEKKRRQGQNIEKDKTLTGNNIE
jgi:hypothetical protein